MTETCRSCGSERIIPSVAILDHDYINERQAEIAIDSRPSFPLFKGRTVGKISAHVCAACGHMELFASNHEELWEKHLKVSEKKENKQKTQSDGTGRRPRVR